MMGLADLGVVAVPAQRAGRELGELEQYVDAETHVGCEHDRQRPGDPRQLPLLRRAVPGGADHERAARGPTSERVADRGVGEREVDGDVGALERTLDPVGDRDGERRRAGERAGVLSDRGVAWRGQRAGQAQAGRVGGEQRDDAAPHATRRAEHRDVQRAGLACTRHGEPTFDRRQDPDAGVIRRDS